MTELFWDRDANDGRGAEVEGRVADSVQFLLARSVQCISRGVMAMDDGRVYIFTVRREGHGDVGSGGRRRLATRMDGTLKDVAAGLFAMERDWIDPDLLDHYTEKINAL
ncbi:hypothetical protein [Streptomyces cucumeris]|uniref:hypothetical protein n=1 Tax=Streptomyces cucumeris TaxID=2962890 RepID=UPI0020C8D56A|nr:hypothetical protein [Streptomyces sp. NEAU-Y11]MCP9209542.1 hypothetical protein [Streptomyces sp. NEAU-Y11]